MDPRDATIDRNSLAMDAYKPAVEGCLRLAKAIQPAIVSEQVATDRERTATHPESTATGRKHRQIERTLVSGVEVRAAPY